MGSKSLSPKFEGTSILWVVCSSVRSLCPASEKSCITVLRKGEKKKKPSNFNLNTKTKNFQVYFEVVLRNQKKGAAKCVKWCPELREMRLEKYEVCVNEFLHPFSERIRIKPWAVTWCVHLGWVFPARDNNEREKRFKGVLRVNALC